MADAGPSHEQELASKIDDCFEFVAALDADNIMQACKGFGTDDKALMGVLCNRSKEQLKKIDHQYKKKFEKSLVEEVKSECSGNYKTFLVSMLCDPTEVDAQALHKAMDGMGTTETILIEIICNRTNEELRKVKSYFEGKYDKPLIDWIRSECSGNLEDLLIECLKCERDEGDDVDEALAAEQAEALFNAGEGVKGFRSKYDFNVFHRVLCGASVQQLDLVQVAYEKTHGKSLRAAVEKVAKGDHEDAMVLRLENRVDAQCSLLMKAMKGMGTDEGAIARVLGGSDKDTVQEIHARYDEKYGGNLVGQLKDECSGSFEDAILLWLQPPGFGYFESSNISGVDPASMDAVLDQGYNLIAEIDAINIREACKGLGTDDDVLTDVLCNRSKAQTQRINACYKKKFEKSLIEEVKDECSGAYETFLVSILADPVEDDAFWLHKAMKGLGTTESILSEIVCTRSNEQLTAVKACFEGRYDKPLVDWINSECSGQYRDLLVECLKCAREEGAPVDMGAAEAAAEALHAAGEAKWGTDEGVFIGILGRSSIEQVDAIEAVFERSYGKSLKASIQDEMSGDLELAMLLRLEDPLDCMCTLLMKAMKGMGTDEGAIARILGGSTKDVVQRIVARYDEKYSGNLVGQLKDECSGNLEKAILKWLKPAEFTEYVAEDPAVAMDEPPPPPEEGGMSVCHEEAKPAVPSVSQGALPPTPPGMLAFAVTCPEGVTPGGPMAVAAMGRYYQITAPPDAFPGKMFLALFPQA